MKRSSLQNFRWLASVKPSLLTDALLQLADNEDLWSLHTERQSFPGSAHHDTEVIFLRGPEEFTKESYFSTVSVPFHLEIQQLSKLYMLANCLLTLLRVTEVGRILVVRLHPLGSIDEHSDQGAYAEYFQRAHFCLQTDGQDYLACGDEHVNMRPGELWWFNHRLEHFGENVSKDTQRIHLIMDYRL